MKTPLNVKIKDTKIVLICDSVKNTDATQNCLKKNMSIPWNILHFINIEEAKTRIHDADVIILDLALEGITTPKEIFKSVQNIAANTPIIVLTTKKKHALSTYVMKNGAADTIVRGGFERLVDAIEFALIRQKIIKGTLDKGFSEQKDRQSLRDSQAMDDKTISDGKDQCILWMQGGYSVQSNTEKDAA